ncbi:MAG: hypothetical protein V9G29_16050 [Burkholderiaceae bacterium]
MKQIYFSGCSGNVTAGKYNMGDRTNRAVLADRLYQAMVSAWRETKRHPLTTVSLSFHNRPARAGAMGPVSRWRILEKKLATGDEAVPAMSRCAGLELAQTRGCGTSHQHSVAGYGRGAIAPCCRARLTWSINSPRSVSGPIRLCWSRATGEGATGYIPTEKHIVEKDPNLGDWWWLAPGARAARLLAAIREALKQG